MSDSMITFKTKPPRLKDLVNQYIMGDVWLRDSPFGPVTDSIILSKNFQIEHSKILRAISKCQKELNSEIKYDLKNKSPLHRRGLFHFKKMGWFRDKPSSVPRSCSHIPSTIR